MVIAKCIIAAYAVDAQRVPSLLAGYSAIVDYTFDYTFAAVFKGI